MPVSEFWHTQATVDKKKKSPRRERYLEFPQDMVINSRSRLDEMLACLGTVFADQLESVCQLLKAA